MGSLTKLSFTRKVLFSVVATVMFFGMLELLLAAAGIERIGFEKDPYVGFSSRIPLYVERPESDEVLETAGNKLAFFNPQEFSRQKPSGAYRIFCVGGSTTFGRPYDDTTSYSGWLRELLSNADQSQSWEVINAGGISYASYRVALLMEELIRYEPDLFVIYSGHNEFLERRTYNSVINTPAAVRGLGAVLSGTRTFSALHRFVHAPAESTLTELPGEVKPILDQSVGLEAYTRDDRLRQQVLAHYRYNLQRMIDIARSCGAGVMLITPAANLRDCAPFKSEHRASLSDAELRRCRKLIETARTAFDAAEFDAALAAIDDARAIDDRHAGLHYLRGRVLDSLGRHSEAKADYVRARDEDVCPLRALTPMREIVAEVAAQNSVPVLDFVKVVETHSDQSIPGENLFLDHVHPTIEGHRLLALELLDLLKAEEIVNPDSSWGDAAIAEVIEAVESQVDTEAHGHALSNLSQVLSWAGKHEEADKLAIQAVALNPSNAETQSLAGLAYARRNDFENAEKHLARALELKPARLSALKAHTNLGVVFARQGKLDEAEAQFLQAMQADPESAKIYNSLGKIAAQKNNLPKAISYFQRAVQIEPEFVMARFNLGNAYSLQGYPVAAAEQFEKILQHQPGFRPARDSLAKMRAMMQQQK